MLLRRLRPTCGCNCSVGAARSSPKCSVSLPQQSQPSAVVSSAGMWWAGHAESFLDDARIARDARGLVDANPLGTAAGYGVNLTLDREHTTQALGFARMQISPVYAQLSRGKFELAALEALGSATLDLRRIAWDLSLFTSGEYAFVALPAQYTTGSSLMPNKRNPDVSE